MNFTDLIEMCRTVFDQPPFALLILLSVQKVVDAFIWRPRQYKSHTEKYNNTKNEGELVCSALFVSPLTALRAINLDRVTA